jgi:hypothetical protein
VGIVGNKEISAIVMLQTNIGDREIIRILGQEFLPCREDDGEIEGEFICVEVCIDEAVFLGEAEESDFGAGFCDAHHHLQITHIRNIACTMPTEKLKAGAGADSGHFVKVRRTLPDIEIPLKQSFVAAEGEAPFARIAFLETGCIRAACIADREIYGGYGRAKFGVVEGNVDAVDFHVSSSFQQKKDPALQQGLR